MLRSNQLSYTTEAQNYSVSQCPIFKRSSAVQAGLLASVRLFDHGSQLRKVSIGPSEIALFARVKRCSLRHHLAKVCKIFVCCWRGDEVFCAAIFAFKDLFNQTGFAQVVNFSVQRCRACNRAHRHGFGDRQGFVVCVAQCNRIEQLLGYFVDR